MTAYELQLFVGNLHFQATEAELGNAIRGAGYRVSDVRIARKEDGIASKGFGFVWLLTDKEQDAVISDLYGIVIRERGIRVERISPKERAA